MATVSDPTVLEAVGSTAMFELYNLATLDCAEQAFRSRQCRCLLFISSQITEGPYISCYASVLNRRRDTEGFRPGRDRADWIFLMDQSMAKVRGSVQRTPVAAVSVLRCRRGSAECNNGSVHLNDDGDKELRYREGTCVPGVTVPPPNTALYALAIGVSESVSLCNPQPTGAVRSLMASPKVDLDQLQKEMLVFLPRLDLSVLCCCSIIDPGLEPHQHLDDCELQCVGGASRLPSSEDASETSSNSGTPREEDPRSIEKRKKHRESMARLRHGWRTSIAALHLQEEKLHSLLRRLIATTSPTAISMEIPQVETITPVDVLRRAYRELVVEQLRLEKERASLEEAKAHRDKYERLLQRELVRIRMFYASKNNS